MSDTDRILSQMLDRQAVIDRVIEFCRMLDLQDWDLFADCFTDPMSFDYSKHTQKPPYAGPREEYVKLAQRAVTGQECQHISSNHKVTLKGDGAECWSNMTGLHHRYLSDNPAENRYDLYGYYDMTLKRDASGIWRISHITQNIHWTEGNPRVMNPGFMDQGEKN